MADPELLDIASQVFDLFKKRTDGANLNIEDIHVNAVYEFHYHKEINLDRLFDAFRLLEKEDLIRPSQGALVGTQYRLTEKGQKTDLAEVVAHFLEDRKLQVGPILSEMKMWAYSIVLTFFVLAFLSFLLQYSSPKPDSSMLFLVGMVAITLVLGLLARAGQKVSVEDRLFFRCLTSYEAIRDGNFGKVEKLTWRVAEGLINSEGAMARTDWKIVNQEVYPLLSSLGEGIRRRLLPAIHTRRDDSALALANLAKLLAYPSLERFRKASSILKDFDEKDYKPLSQKEKLLAYFRKHTSLYLVGVVVAIFGIAAILYFSMHLLNSIVTGVPFSLDVCVRDMFPYNYAQYLALSTAIIGLLLLSRRR